MYILLSTGSTNKSKLFTLPVDDAISDNTLFKKLYKLISFFSLVSKDSKLLSKANLYKKFKLTYMFPIIPNSVSHLF